MIVLMEIASKWWTLDNCQLSFPFIIIIIIYSGDNSEFHALGLQHGYQHNLCVVIGQERSGGVLPVIHMKHGSLNGLIRCLVFCKIGFIRKY